MAPGRVGEIVAVEPRIKRELCPKCGSSNVEPVDRKGELLSAIGTTVIGFLLSLVFAPVLFLVIPVAVYLLVTATKVKGLLTCLECRKRWRSVEAVPSGE